jgi:predicted SAM-dependent methyltransferase
MGILIIWGENKMTRGTGLLEGFLRKQRYKIARSKIKIDDTTHILDFGSGLGSPVYNWCVVAETFDLMDKSSIPIWTQPDNKFDYILMLAVIEHMTRDEAIKNISVLRQKLKPNGKLIITTPAPWSDSLLRTMAKFNLVSPEEINEHVEVYHEVSMYCTLDKAGFKRENIEHGYFEMGLNQWFVVSK